MDASKYVYEIPLGDAKAFIINGEKTILVDTGIAPFPPEVFAFIEETGFKLGDEQQIEHLRKGSFQFIMDFIKEKGFDLTASVNIPGVTNNAPAIKIITPSISSSVGMIPCWRLLPNRRHTAIPSYFANPPPIIPVVMTKRIVVVSDVH